MAKVFVAGYGYVGKAMVEMLKDHYEVLVFDPKYFGEKPQGTISFVDSFEESSNSCLGIVCTPTPSKPDGSCDISLVEESVREIKSPIILIKSTIEIGTTDRLIQKFKKEIVFSPEYVGESKYWHPYFNTNMKEVPMLIVGGERRNTTQIIDLLAPILGPTKYYYQTSAKVAEIVKYMENTFFALKVTFCNEIFSICEKAGVDYWDVREAWLLDPRINRMHTAVFKENRGFGGKCYPKDVNALVSYSEKVGYEPSLLKEILRSNERFRESIKKDS
jgi:nucleotide sugar dehydrogenase